MTAVGDVYADRDGPGVYLIVRPYAYRRGVWDALVLEPARDEFEGEVRSLQQDWLEVCAEKVAP